MNRIVFDPWQRRAWVWAFGCFLLAGATGVAFRFGLVWGLPAGLAFDNLRHAHSHLMYFGWVTPALFAVLYALVPAVTGRPVRRPRAGAWVVGFTVGAALLSYPFFLLYGYKAVPVGSAELPLAAIAAALNLVAWYGFAWRFRGELLQPDRRLSLTTAAMVRGLWKAALAFLVLSSLGAWGRGALNAAGVEDSFWQDAALHLFLDVFSDGWMVLALLGAGYAVHTRPDATPAPWAVWGRRLAVVGIPVAFLVGMPVYRVPALPRAVAGVGSFLSGLGMLLMVADLARARKPSVLWSSALAALALKAAAASALALPAVAAWAERANLRILYLHVLLLGGITLGLVSVAEELGGLVPRRAALAFAAAAGIVLASLVTLTELWPSSLRGLWVLHGAAWSAAALWLVALWLWCAAVCRRRPSRTWRRGGSPPGPSAARLPVTASAAPAACRSGGRSAGEAGSRWGRRRPAPAGCAPSASPPASAPP